MKNNTRWISIFSLLFIIAFLAGCNKEVDDQVQAERQVPVKVETVSYGSLSDSNILSGTVIPEDEADVSPQATAEITDILVEKGDVVQRGDVLAVLDDFAERNALQQQLNALEQQQNALEQQQVSLRQAQSSLKSAKNGKATAEINHEQSKASLEQAKASLAEAQKSKKDNLDNMEFQIKNAEIALKQTKQSFERVKALYEEGLTSKQNYDDALVAVENAENALAQAKLNRDQSSSDVGLESLRASVEQARIGVRIAESSIRDAEIGVEQAEMSVDQAQMAVEQAQMSVDQAQLAVDSAQENLDKKTVYAPISGQVTDIMAEVGELASPQAPLVTIVAVDQAKVSVNVLPEMLTSFTVGDTVDVQVDGVEDMLTATISYISPLSSGSGLFTVEADLVDTDGQVRPGMIASFVLDEVLVAESILVPTEAIVQKEGLDMVFIVEDGVAVQKEVVVNRYGTETTAVVGDLQENDKVVTSGQNLLEDGDKVTVMEEE